MSNVCISETREDDGIGTAEPKMNSVAFCLAGQNYSGRGEGLSCVPVYPSRHC
jgi:hypothetical protein